MKNTILDAFHFRYACKEFDKEKKISKEDFELILETGRLSPSSFGWEPWQFLVIQNPALRNKLKEVTWGAQGTLPTASHFVILLARKNLTIQSNSPYLKYIANDIQKRTEEVQQKRMEMFKNFQENDFDLTTDRALFDWTCKQTYIPLGNMMTTAALLGIDSCPIEGFNPEKVEALLDKENIIDILQYGVSVMVAFGYRTKDQEVFPKTRRPMDEVAKYI